MGLPRNHVSIDHAARDVLVDDIGGVQKGLIHILCGLGASLHEDKSMLLGEGLSLLARNLALGVQVTLVTDKHNGNRSVAVCLRVLQPRLQVVESLLPGYVVYQKCTARATVVGASDGPERLLARCVPDLELDVFVVNAHHPSPKLHSNC